jgi:hypothetical protein
METDMSAGTEGFTHPEFLVESEWLAAHLGDPEFRILDCTIHLIANPDIGYTVKPGREDFEKGHIPGAQYIDLQADLSAAPELRFMPPGAGFRCGDGPLWPATKAASFFTAPPTRNGRRGYGGCCAITASTTPPSERRVPEMGA